MTKQCRAAALAALTIGLSASSPAAAALWSSTNSVSGISGMATMEISLTGDQVTVAAQVDVAVPAGITNVTHTPLNGASCNYLSASRVVRVLVLDPGLDPLPAHARPMCSIQYRVSRSTSTWFPMQGQVCVRVEGTTLPPGACARDEGYLTVIR